MANAIADTSTAIRKRLLRLAKHMGSSPLAGTTLDDVVLAGGKLVSRRDASRSVSIADIMRHDAVDRIEQEKTTNPTDDPGRAHNTHAAVFAEVMLQQLH